MITPSFSLATAGLFGAGIIGACLIIQIQSNRIEALKKDVSAERANVAALNELAVQNAADLGAANARLDFSQALAASRMQRTLDNALMAATRTQTLEGGLDDLRHSIAGLQCATGVTVSDGLLINQADRNAALRSRQGGGGSGMDPGLLSRAGSDGAGGAGAEPS